MDRADKIFTALALLGLAGFLLWRNCNADVPGRVNVSVAPDPLASGPAYLVSNLPTVRPFNDAAPVVSETM